MDRNSLRTSVVIEVANQEESDDQKTYHIDFDDLDVPKDYVIDQVFCGENITVYALFEVPEDSNVSSNDQMVDVTSHKAHDSYRVFQNNSSKKLMSHRKMNGFKQSLMSQEEPTMNILPNKDNDNKSFYCLKHLSGDYDTLTPERENSELKVLYSKPAPPRDSKSTKFKAISKGVNTDIVQSPKIISEVRKAVRQNFPVSKPAEVKSISSGIPSYEVIEMEMRQSFSSMSSYGDNRKPSKKSVPNFFLVPLLMMDDGVLSHFQNDEKIQKLPEEKERKTIVREMVSMGTNTDTLMPTLPEIGEKQNENVLDMPPSESVKLVSEVEQKQPSCNLQGKLSNRNAILIEIKELQGKLNALIKSMESDTSDFYPSELDSITLEEPSPEKLYPFETTLSEFKPLTRRQYDDLSITSSLTFPQCKTGKKKPAGIRCKDQKESEEKLVPTLSNSMELTSGESASKSQLTRSNSIPNCRDVKVKEELKAFPSQCSIVWSELDNRKGMGLSKSTTGLSSLDSKFINGLKKSFSFDLRDVKLEVMCLKKIKNTSFKLETKANIRIPQKGEAIMKCEMGDEACNKPKTSKIDLLSLSKPMETVEDLKLEQKNLDSKKILKEEEGDACTEIVYSTQNQLNQMIARTTESIEVHFCDTISITPKDNILSAENILPTPVKSKGMCNVVEAEPKAVTEAEPKTVTEAEPKVVTEAELESGTEAEPKAVTEAEPKAVTEAEPEAVTEVEPKAVIEAEPKVTEAEPKAVKETEPKAVKEAEPKAVKQAEQKASKVAEPKAVKEAEPKAVKQAEQKAAKVAEPKAVKEAEPKAVKEAEPKPVKETESKAVKETESKAVKEAEPKVVTEAESKAVTEAEPKTIIEAEPKAVTEAEKPQTPSKTSKRSALSNANAKKEVKTLKKMNYQPNKAKQVDKTAKTEAKDGSQQETAKARSVTGSRKFTMKGTAESKLHVDRLMKPESPTAPKTAPEKPATKSSRLASQKRDSSDPTEENKEKTPKTNPILNRRENPSMPALERIGEANTEKVSQKVVSESPGVVVELLAEKPSEKLCLDGNKKCKDLMKTLDGDALFELNSKTQEEVSDDSLNPEKPVVKSVWALTKVLLFEDGSKKIEILEASLTPPGYSLPKTENNAENDGNLLN